MQTQTPTFSQRMGIAPMSEQMKLDQLSKGLRARVWAALCDYVESHSFKEMMGGWDLTENAAQVMSDLHVLHLEQPLDEYSSTPSSILDVLKPVVLQQGY